jgi:Ca2+/H+ antiporter
MDMSASQAVTDLTDVGSPRTPLSSFLRSPMNWLLLFIPITIALEHLVHVSAPVLFFMAAVAIVPIAAQIVGATEQLATRTGDAVGGLLNATFGNAPELIIAFVALKAGYFDMVRASLVGAILANLLLALGIAFLLGGLRFHQQRFNSTAARAYSTMMFLAAVSMTVPSAFSRVFAPNESIRQEQLLNIGIAVLLLVVYALYILFSLRRIVAACSLGANFQQALERGYNYWKRTFFLADGWPKYYHDDPYPVDAHAAASAIVTLLECRDLDETSSTMAHQIASWTSKNLRDEQGFFYYQRRRFYTVRKPYMRWTQAWMLYALARLLEDKPN